MAAESTVRILFLGDSSQALRSVSRLESGFSTLGRTAKLAAGILGVALVGGMVAATKAAIDFQHQMEFIHTQAGASTKEVERMSKAILGLAAAVGTGPEDLAKGLYHIESAGIRGTAALKILTAAAEGAKVGNADLETVTNALVGAFKSGVKGAGSMEHTMAVLNATVGAGNMRMNDLTSAMSTGLLSAAKGVGISIQDVGAALSELTVQGQGATASATRLQMAFLTMAANTSKGSAALNTIGISQMQLANDMRSHGLIFALQDLQKHLQDSGKSLNEQQQIIADVFGRRSLKAIEPLLQHMDDVRKRQEQINKTTDQFGNAWIATTQTVQFQLARAKAAVVAAAIPIGTLLLPLVSRIAGAVASAANEFGGFVKQLQNAPGLAAKFKVIAGGAKVMAKEIVQAIRNALLGFSTFNDPSKLTGRFHAGAVASTFHDGLVQELGKLDWGMIGTKIIDGMIKGIKTGVQFGQAVVGALSNALAGVNWDQLARKAGPLIVTALASAISAATDPSFWIHHWDLALSIALVAFGGSIGKVAGRLGLLLLKPFADMAPRLGVVIGDLVSRIPEWFRSGLGRVAASMGHDLANLWRSIFGTSENEVAAGSRKISGLLRFTFKVLGVDAAIHAIGQFASYVVSQIGRAVTWIIGEFNKLPGVVKAAFDLTPIGFMIGAIQTLIRWVSNLIGWISKIHLPHIGGGVSVNLPKPDSRQRRAAGGFVLGQSGSPQLVLAHAGEVILNPMQQAAFGGAAFFKQAFGFTEGGVSFAAGGIVGHKPKRRHSSRSPHHPRHHRNTVNAKSAAAKAILASLGEIDENESNADRAYGQLVRQFDLTQEQFIRTDASGNSYISKQDIDQRVSEIDQLITARNNYLALLDEEKADLEKAIARLKAAIAALIKAIRSERQQAAQDAKAVRDLSRQLGQTKDAKAKTRIQNQITARGNSRSRHLSNVGTLQSSLTEFRASLGGVTENLRDTLPMDMRDVNLDIAALQSERKDVVGTTLPTSGGGGGTSADQAAEIAALIAQIASLNLALGIQTAQSAIIGSFAKGTLSVPETGLAFVHAGEQIVPAGQTKGRSGNALPPVVNVYVDDAMGWLKPYIRAEAVNASEAISVRIGQRATERARSGRY